MPFNWASTESEPFGPSSIVDAFAPLPSCGRPADLAHPLPQESLRLTAASPSVSLGPDALTPSALGNTLLSKELPAALFLWLFLVVPREVGQCSAL